MNAKQHKSKLILSHFDVSRQLNSRDYACMHESRLGKFKLRLKPKRLSSFYKEQEEWKPFFMAIRLLLWTFIFVWSKPITHKSSKQSIVLTCFSK